MLFLPVLGFSKIEQVIRVDSEFIYTKKGKKKNNNVFMITEKKPKIKFPGREILLKELMSMLLIDNNCITFISRLDDNYSVDHLAHLNEGNKKTLNPFCHTPETSTIDYQLNKNKFYQEVEKVLMEFDQEKTKYIIMYGIEYSALINGERIESVYPIHEKAAEQQWKALDKANNIIFKNYLLLLKV